MEPSGSLDLSKQLIRKKKKGKNFPNESHEEPPKDDNKKDLEAVCDVPNQTTTCPSQSNGSSLDAGLEQIQSLLAAPVNTNSPEEAKALEMVRLQLTCLLQLGEIMKKKIDSWKKELALKEVENTKRKERLRAAMEYLESIPPDEESEITAKSRKKLLAKIRKFVED